MTTDGSRPHTPSQVSHVVTTPGRTRQLVNRVKSKGGRQGVAALVDQAVVSGVNFATGILIARALNDQVAFGYYGLIFAAMLFVNGIQNSLIMAPLMVFAQRREGEERKRYIKSLWMIQLLICVAAAIVTAAVMVAGAAWWSDLYDRTGVLPMVLVFVTYLGQEFIRRVLFATRDSVGGLIADCISYLLQLGAIIAMIALGNGSLAGVLWAMALTSLASCVYGTWRARLDVGGIKRSEMVATWKEHWDYGRWLMNGSIAQWGSTNLYQYIVAFFLSPAATGLLNAGRNLLAFSHFFLLGLENFVPSTMTRRLMKGGLDDMLRWSNVFRLILGGVMAVYCLAVSFFAVPILSALFGSSYAEANVVVPLIAVVYFAMAANRPSLYGLRVLDAPKWTFYGHMTSAIATVIVSVPLVMWWGIYGAGIGMLLSQLLTLIVMNIGYRKVLREYRAKMAAMGSAAGQPDHDNATTV